MAIPELNLDPSNLLVQTTEVPLEESKPGVFAAFLREQLKICDVVSNAAINITDGRVSDLVNIMISCIPNLKKQAELRKERDERIEKEVPKNNSNEEKARQIKDINIELMGKVSIYMDRYMGGERENRIAFIVPIKEMRELLQKANPQHFKEHIHEEE